MLPEKSATYSASPLTAGEEKIGAPRFRFHRNRPVSASTPYSQPSDAPNTSVFPTSTGEVSTEFWKS